MNRSNDIETLEFMRRVLLEKRYRKPDVLNCRIDDVMKKSKCGRGIAIQRLFCNYVSTLIGFMFDPTINDKEDDEQSRRYV